MAGIPRTGSAVRAIGHGLGPGRLLEFGRALRAPAGRIHWAGTETSDHWVGYMDGAVRSGERAAAEALAELWRLPTPRRAREPAAVVVG